MEYKVTIDNFEGPLDLLLHLIKQSDIEIWDINIAFVTDQYLSYIKSMEELNLNIASEYIVMAAELMEIKSRMLLPKSSLEVESEFEEDPKEQLINRLLQYKQYKEVTSDLRVLEEERNKSFTKGLSDLTEYLKEQPKITNDVSLEDLITALNSMIEKQGLDKPLNTKITNKEYSVSIRSDEIKNILKDKKKVLFEELFNIKRKDYIIVTFLSILELAKKQDININQDNNFKQIYLTYIGK